MSKLTFKLASIGKKVITALAGLFLLLFLAMHMSINLLLTRADGGDAFRAAVHFLTSNPLIKVMEIVLFSAFIVHMLIGVFLTIQNWLARPVGYKVAQKSSTHFMSKYMFHTGVITFIFLLFHLWHFYAIKIGLAHLPAEMTNVHDFYPRVVTLFSTPLYSLFYLVSFVFLAFHLSHALQSGFQTLGLNHNRYTPAVKVFSNIYAAIIFLGFSWIPVYYLFLR